MQYDLYVSVQYIGGIDAIGNSALRWVEGYHFSYPYQGEIRDFMVKTLTLAGTRMRKIRAVPTTHDFGFPKVQSGGRLHHFGQVDRNKTRAVGRARCGFSSLQVLSG